MSTETPAWSVIPDAAHTETVLPENGSGIVTVWKVPYTIDSGPAKGSRHSVTVPAAQFHAEGVKQAIMEHAANVHAVANLSHNGA